MKKEFELLFNLGQPNINNVIYDVKSFKKAIKRAVKSNVPVYIGDENENGQQYSNDIVGKLIGVSNLKINEIPRVTLEISDKALIDTISSGVTLGVSTSSISSRLETTITGNKYADIESTDAIILTPYVNVRKNKYGEEV